MLTLELRETNLRRPLDVRPTIEVTGRSQYVEYVWLHLVFCEVVHDLDHF